MVIIAARRNFVTYNRERTIDDAMSPGKLGDREVPVALTREDETRLRNFDPLYRRLSHEGGYQLVLYSISVRL